MSLFNEEHTVGTYNQSSLRPSKFTRNKCTCIYKVTSYQQSILIKAYTQFLQTKS